MKITLATCGSRGDVQPLIALALALQARGHKARICASPEHEEWVKSYGCDFRPVGVNLMAFLEEHRDMNITGVMPFLRLMKQEIVRQFRTLPDLIADADLVIGSSLLIGCPSVAEYLNKPYCHMAFCPQALPSGYHPMVHMRRHDLPRWINTLSWLLFRHLDINFNYRRLINAERRRLGLAPIRDVLSHLPGIRFIVASDPLLGTVPPDIKVPVTQTGYLHLDQRGELPGDLLDFIEEGPPSVYIGFGSMPSERPEESARMLVSAMKSAGQRMVLSKGWAGLIPKAADASCYVADAVPHPLLFPRMAAIVHHGGSGTTATAARAGVPQIIIPHIMDQFYWGHHIHRKNLGPKPVSRFSLTPEKLAAAVSECLSNSLYRETARQFGQKLRRQSPLENAVRLIESLSISQNPVIQDRNGPITPMKGETP